MFQNVKVVHNGIELNIQKWPSHKMPILSVSFEGENNFYKVASFKDEPTATWFIEILEEFFGHNFIEQEVEQE